MSIPIDLRTMDTGPYKQDLELFNSTLDNQFFDKLELVGLMGLNDPGLVSRMAIASRIIKAHDACIDDKLNQIKSMIVKELEQQHVKFPFTLPNRIKLAKLLLSNIDDIVSDTSEKLTEDDLDNFKLS